MNVPVFSIVHTTHAAGTGTNLWQVTVDLVSVEVGIVGVAVGVMHPDGLVAWVAKHANAMGHDSRLVESRLTVHEHTVPVVEMPPNLHPGAKTTKNMNKMHTSTR